MEFKLRREHNLQVAAILNDPEASENDKYVALQFLRNAETAVKGVLPFCQDTGTAIIHGEKGHMSMMAYSKNTKIISMNGGFVSNAVCDTCTTIIPASAGMKDKLEEALSNVGLKEYKITEFFGIEMINIPMTQDGPDMDLVEKYVSLKTGVRHNTVAGYKTVINMLKKESFGNLRIDKVRLSDAKAWLIKLQQIDGRGYSSIHSIRGVLRPAFQMAVDDDLLRKNPFEFELASVIVNDSVTREAITRKQQRDLLKFIQEDKHFSRYYDAIYILFHTGLRISEFCGLTVSEIEYGEMRIKVDHQLQRTAQMQYVIEEPKTDKGIRYVPMTEAVAACFRRIIANRKTPKVEPMVEGYAGFLFLDKNDMPMVALHWEKYLEHIIQKYNKIYRIQMPKVTPHVCRHTFCSNMAKSGMNPKTLQYIMGHADISVTLNTYTHVNFDDAKEEVYRIANS